MKTLSLLSVCGLVIGLAFLGTGVALEHGLSEGTSTGLAIGGMNLVAALATGLYLLTEPQIRETSLGFGLALYGTGSVVCYIGLIGHVSQLAQYNSIVTLSAVWIGLFVGLFTYRLLPKRRNQG